MHTLGLAGINANLSHYEAVRIKHTELALEALAEELKWRARRELKTDTEETLKSMLFTTPN